MENTEKPENRSLFDEPSEKVDTKEPSVVPTEKPKKPANLPTSASLEMEKGKEKPNTIFLFVRGRFFRAYNGSAWLIHCLFKDTYKILRDKAIGKDTFVYLGFPKEMLSEIIGSEAIISEQTDTYSKILVPEDALKSIPDYDKWLREVPVKDKSENDLPSRNTASHSGRIEISNVDDVIQRLATYHIERHTLLENQMFLSDIIDSLQYISHGSV